ncbi:MAG: hypothetical protein ACTTI3_07145 [Treponema sp.]
MNNILNIYTQAFQLLDLKMLYNVCFIFLFKNKLSMVRIFEKYKNIEYGVLYYTFKSKYHILHKIFHTNVFMYISVKNVNQLEAVLKDCTVKIQNDFNVTVLNIKAYVVLSIDQENSIYQDCKNIVNNFTIKNSIIVINKNNDVIWHKSDIMITAINERNKFLINELHTKKDMVDIEVFKKECMNLLNVMFMVMRNDVARTKYKNGI